MSLNTEYPEEVGHVISHKNFQEIITRAKEQGIEQLVIKVQGNDFKQPFLGFAKVK